MTCQAADGSTVLVKLIWVPRDVLYEDLERSSDAAEWKKVEKWKGPTQISCMAATEEKTFQSSVSRTKTEARPLAPGDTVGVILVSPPPRRRVRASVVKVET